MVDLIIYHYDDRLILNYDGFAFPNNINLSLSLFYIKVLVTCLKTSVLTEFERKQKNILVF
jgi:hypothetical protein